MAQVLRFKLQALYCPRLLPSPPLVSKILDPRHISWRCYGESALLEESCNSTLNANDIDGNGKVVNGGGDLTRKDGVEDKASKESDLDKLTNSICDKLWAKANVVRGEKDKGVQGQQNPLSTKEIKKADKDDQWQQVVSTVRTMVLKNKAKAAAGNKSAGVPKTEANEGPLDFSFPVPEAGGEFGVSRGSNASNKDTLVMNALGKSLKQKTSQSQFSHQQKSKDTKPLGFLESRDNDTTLSSQTSQLQFLHQQKSKDTKPLSFLESLDDNMTLSSLMSPDDNTSDFSPALKSSNLWDKNQLKNNDAMPGSVNSKISKGKNNALPQAAEDGSSAQVWNQSSCKGTTQFTSDFKGEGSGDAPPAQLHGKIVSCASEVTPQASANDPHTGYMVCVQSLPSICNPALIKASMAVHGEVLGFFKKAVQSDHFNVYIQFKTAQSMEGALAARKLQIGAKSYLIARTDHVFSTVVRLSKVNKDTTQKQLFSICGKYGSIDNIMQRTSGVYDVFYQVKELPNMTRILGSLNEVMHNRSTWIAVPAPTLHPSVQKEALKNPEWQAWHEIQVNQALNRIEKGIDSVSVLFEDLKELTALGKEFSKR